MRLIEELKRRGVLRVGSAYVVGAWLLAQVAEFLTETFAAPLWVLRSIVIVLSVALGPVLVFTWMFEFTPAGLRRQSELDRAGAVVSRSGRPLDYLIAMLLLVSAGWLAWQWSAQLRVAEEAVVAQPDAELEAAATAPQPQAPPNSIAVLPFLSLSTAPDSGMLADGIAEELLGVLGRNRELRVTARSSAFRFRNQDRDLREIARLLGVRYVLEGSVRFAAPRVKVGAQLIDATSGLQLWSESYERTLADLFALQEEIAGEVAKALQIVVTATSGTPATSGTRSVEAHMELLRARQVGASRKAEDLDQAIAHLRRALVLDPGYVAAYVELAYAVPTRAMQSGEQDPAVEDVAPLIEKALQLDPRSGEALVMRGALLTEDPALAERTMREGLALAPSYARGYEILAGHIGFDPARLDEALALLDQAIALDPLAPRNYQVKGVMLWNGKGDFQGAEQQFRRALELEPRFRMALVQLSMLNMSRGDFAPAVDFAERALRLDAGTIVREAMIDQYLHLGDVEAAERTNAPATLAGTLAILLYRNDIATAMKLIHSLPADELPVGPPPLVVTFALRDARANGTWAQNLVLALQLVPYDGELPAAGEMESFGFAHAQLAALLRGAGRIEEADGLEKQLLAWLDAAEQAAPVWQRGPYSWTRAMVLASTGREDEALDALEIAFAPARPYWWGLLDHNPVFESLQAEPRYVALRDRLQRHLDGQRALIARLREARDHDVDTGSAPGGAVETLH